jgi:hypothetical protein
MTYAPTPRFALAALVPMSDHSALAALAPTSDPGRVLCSPENREGFRVGIVS